MDTETSTVQDIDDDLDWSGLMDDQEWSDRPLLGEDDTMWD